MGGRRWRRKKATLSFPALHSPVRGQDGYTIVTISGELDIASVPVLREQILGLLRPQAGRIVIDLSGVTFCDASGLAALVGASRRAGQLDGVLHLAAATPLVATLLRLTGLNTRFEIYATVPDALSAHPFTGVPVKRCAEATSLLINSATDLRVPRENRG